MQTTLHPKALRYLAAVAQLGSVQAAAREVSISASAIDRQIHLLEDDLGVPLFERLPRGMQLTAAGELVLALSQRWKSDLSRTLSDIKQMQGVNQGQLRIAAMDSHANSFLPPFIHSVASEHPRIMLEVEIVNTDDAVRHLTGGEVDMAVAFNLRPQRDVQIVWTAELPLGCVVAKDHPLADRLQVTLQDVADWPLAAQSRVLAIRRYLESKHAWLLAQARPPLVTNSLQLVKSLVRSGSHVAITSELDVGPELLAGDVRFIRLKDRNASPQTISVALCASRSLPRIAKMVADILSKQVASYLQQVRQASEREGCSLGSVSSSALSL